MSLPFVEIYTDGACAPNPGTGGWGAVLISWSRGGARKEISGAVPQATNNQMELLAAIKALEALKRPCRVRLSTDSEYLQRAFADGWLERWKRNGWKSSRRKPIVNVDAWKRLQELAEVHRVEWSWVKAHDGHPENSRADELAVLARKRLAAQGS